MQNFTFHNPTKIIFGKGTIGALKREIPAGKKIMDSWAFSLGSRISTGTKLWK